MALSLLLLGLEKQIELRVGVREYELMGQGGACAEAKGLPSGRSRRPAWKPLHPPSSVEALGLQFAPVLSFQALETC